MKKILILGGTQFIGRTLVEQLQKSNKYDITLFNRQQTGKDLFPNIKKIKGSRETDDVSQIAQQDWEYVIDVSCYYPDSLDRVLKSLKGTLQKYMLISTCSVYDNTEHQTELSDETAEILSCTPEQRSDRANDSYGQRKAECERILQNTTHQHLILRPALVYGNYDHTDRLYYWLHQVKEKSKIILPDAGERVFSLTYVHDLVQTIIAGLETPLTGIYNVISAPKTSIQQIVNTAAKQLDATFETVNASPHFLHKNHINQWSDMPLWLDCDHYTYSNEKLKKDTDMQLTNLEEGLQNTIAYYNTLNWKEPIYGMSEATRLKLLEKLALE
ncbi:MAG: NAD-dependent epimerase/dehydratase family protein [Bacteroidota bacterium]